MAENQHNSLPTNDLGIITIVGSHGRMGDYFASRLMATNAREIRGIDIPLAPQDCEAAICDADLVFLCIHVDVIGQVIKNSLLPYLNGKTVLADIGSVKMLPIKRMRELYDGPVVGTHPLFGPYDLPAGSPPRRVIIVPDALNENATQYVERVFTSLGNETYRATSEAHDRAMAAFHNMNFLSTVAYFAALGDPTPLEPFLLPSVKRRIEAARVSLVNDADMFLRLTRENPMTTEIMEEFMKQLKRVCDKDELPKLIEQSQVWFANKSQKEQGQND